MNNTFSFHRFGRYAATELRASRHLLFTIIWVTAAVQVGLILITLFLFDDTLESANQTIYRVMIIGSGVTVAILISGAFKSYRNSMSAPRVMMLPVSRCEKFTYAFIFNTIIIPVIITAVILLTTLIISTFTNDSYSFTLTDLMTIKGADANISYTFRPYWEMICNGFIICCAYFLGAISFRRAPFILTSVSLIVISILIGWFLVFYLVPNLATYTIDVDGTTFAHLYLPFYIIYYLSIPIMIFLTWLRFSKLQLKK